MKTSVVILNFNGKNYLKKFLPSVVKYSPNATIVVADNGSTDDSVQFVKSNYAEVKLILLEKNFGFAQGYNLALEQLDTEYYVLLNSDVEVSENWLTCMENYLDQNRETVAVQPKIKSFTKKNSFEYAGACGGFIDKYGYPFCRGRVMNTVEEDKGQYDNRIEIFWATGACLMIRSKSYWEVGGLDGSFFAHQEEIDLCWRLKARGGSIMCLPQSVVYHVGGGTLNAENPFKTYLNFRNNLILLYKNQPKNQFRKTIVVRFFLDLLAMFRFLISGKKDNAKSVCRAIKDFWITKKKYKSDRTENLLKTKVFFPEGTKKGSILLDYYLRNKKEFESIKI